jgi:hypothetical protein
MGVGLKGMKVESRKQKARRQKAEGRKQKAESRRQKAESRKQFCRDGHKVKAPVTHNVCNRRNKVGNFFS